MRPFRRLSVITAALALLTSAYAPAGVHGSFKNRTVPTIQALRGGSVNHSSNIQFWQTNYGELFLDISVANGKSGTFWPRGYGFSYIFGGGFWFGAQKNGVKHVLVGYNPYNGGSWFQPGSVASAQTFYDSVKSSLIGKGRYPNESDNAYGQKFTIYYGTDFDKLSGRPKDASKKLSNWPIWDTSPDDNVYVGVNHYFGEYVDDIAKRDTSVYPIRYITKVTSRYDSVSQKTIYDTTVFQKGGPAFISEEDMFTVVNDMDTTYFAQKSNGRFYPLKCEVQRTIYSWGSEVNKNYVFIVYKIFNRSNSILDSCWLAPVMDADIGSAANDEDGFYNTDPTMNLALQWSDKEANVPLSTAVQAYPGVIGMDFLESPAVYKRGEVADSLIGTIKPGIHPNSEQLGLVRFKRWKINEDPTDDDARYAFMASNVRDTAPNPPEYSDKRFLMGTGPFRLMPGQSAQVVVGLMIARDSARGDFSVDASKDAAVALDRRAQVVYDSNFRVPVPPQEPTFTSVTPLSGGTFVRWDTLSEFSFDPISTGMDFLGYRLYRGRRDLVGDNGTTLYDKDKNPYGYKLVKEWKLSDLDSVTFQSINNALPSDNATAAVRQQYYQMLNMYMDSLTNHHTYYDFGDDNHDGQVTDEEKLINDVDYYYWIAAFDQGDQANGISSQQTTGKVGQSKTRVHPVSSYAGDQSTYQVLSPQGMLGGLSDFKWRVQNQEVINQLLAGDTLSVQFTPHMFDYPGVYRVYGLDMRVRDDQKAVDVTYPYYYYRFPAIYSTSYATGPNVPMYTITDTTKIAAMRYGQDGSTVYALHNGGLLRSNDTSFAPNQFLLNAIEHSMNYSFYEVVSQRSFGDSVVFYDTTIIKHTTTGLSDTTYATRKQVVYNPKWVLLPYQLALPQYLYKQRGPMFVDVTATKLGTDSVYRHISKIIQDSTLIGDYPFNVLQGSDTVAMYWDNTGSLAFDSSADNGQYDYILEFTQGGVEQRTVKGVDYNVPYLNVNVRGEQIYTVNVNGVDSVVRIVYNLVPGDSVTTDLAAGQWTMEPLIWHFGPNSNTDAGRNKQYVGYDFSKGTTPNKYYLTAHGSAPGDTNTLAFVNRVRLGGMTVFLDSALKMLNRFSRDNFPGMFMRPSATDMKVGSAVRIRYVGGSLGMPTPGASFKTVFTPSVPQGDSSKVTASQLANVHVWPNPYIIGNSVDPNAPGLQKPSYNDRLVFNHLPPICKISIFNVAGELIRTINHNGGSEEYWDLLSEGRQRVGSQLIVAQVESTNGEKVILKIAVIVQGR